MGSKMSDTKQAVEPELSLHASIYLTFISLIYLNKLSPVPSYLRKYAVCLLCLGHTISHMSLHNIAWTFISVLANLKDFCLVRRHF